ncbi:acetyl-CoA carboxylase biotin carboxylase subunit family protein [Nocardiopsis sp. B62]|uniref:ATP-grasp domain-containing protein n=1 Tax=Nocardiopsis sp. B62 TaxID=2824874 RepID=UPI001B3686DD|nr:hypothetical protein [Nocardiopsis sp. B62]MBQ1082401.1 hypothetical protein [Nocardiopsis sp. B62]
MILILVSPRQRRLDLRAALGEDLGRTLLITGGPLPTGAEDAALTVPLEEYGTEAIVAAGLRLAERYPIERVVSYAESDVIAAARLREQLSLVGQSPASAAAYRDKALMRRHTAAAGLPGPRSWCVEKASQVRAFVHAHGVPVVVKPRRASGSVGVRVLDDHRALGELPEKLPDHVVEEFVPGTVVHVDGLMVGGEPVFALPAVYTELGCLAHLADQGGGSSLLPPEHPWYTPLVEELWNVVRALPPADDLLLHAEFFVSEGRTPVLCEIASRMPGHPIPPMLDRALDTSLQQVWTRVAAGLECDTEALGKRAAEGRLVANYGLPPRLGALAALPEAPPPECAPWVRDLEFGDGQVWDADRYARRKSGDFVLTWTVTAPDADTLQERLTRSAELLEAQVRWEPPPRDRGHEEAVMGVGAG